MIVKRTSLIILLYLICIDSFVYTSYGDHLFSGITISDSEENETTLDGGRSSLLKETPIPEADAYCKSGMILKKKGFTEEAVYNFKLATELYEKAFNEIPMSKEELIAVRENLYKINEQLNVLRLQHKPVNIARKAEFIEAVEGEYWIIESTTILLKSPEVPDNSTQLLHSLISGIKPGALVIILESKGIPSKWLKVRMIDDSEATYVEGWILSDMVTNARHIIKR